MPSSSDQKPMIYVQTLGGFSIKTGDLQINDNRNQSKKPWALLEYLIVFQKKEISPAMPTFRQYWDVISSLMVCRSPVFPYKAYHKRPEHLQAEDLRSHGFHLSDKSFLQTYFSRKHHEIRYHH